MENQAGSTGEPDLQVGFDLGGTKMQASVLQRDGTMLSSERVPSRGNDGMDEGLLRMIDLTRQAISTAGVPAERVSAIGVACPAVVDLERGVLVEAPNLGWENVPVAEAFEKAFPGKQVAVLNDVDAGTFGEYLFGAGQGARTVLGIFPGTGLGGGCVYDGTLLRGRRYSCMEIGNLRLPGPSLFGSRESPARVEEIVSRLGLAGAAAVAAYRGDAPTVFENCGSDLSLIKSGALAAAAKAGDPAVLEAIDNCIFYLSIATAGAVDLLGPDRIVLGGGLVEKMPEIFTQGLEKHVKKLVSRGLAGELEVVAASLGDNASVVGAAAFAAEKIF